MQESSQLYDIFVTNEYNESGAVGGTGTNVGGTSFNFSTGVVEVKIPTGATNTTFIAHELQHAYQFEKGLYSMGPALKRFGDNKNFLYDKHDELNAYNQWGALFDGKSVSSIESLPKRYEDVASGPVDATTHPVISSVLKQNLTLKQQRKAFQTIANHTLHAFRVNGVTYYKKR